MTKLQEAREALDTLLYDSNTANWSNAADLLHAYLSDPYAEVVGVLDGLRKDIGEGEYPAYGVEAVSTLIKAMRLIRSLADEPDKPEDDMTDYLDYPLRQGPTVTANTEEVDDMTHEKERLKPCPFCGGGANEEQTRGSFGGYHLTSIYCEDCSASASRADEWNTRTPSPELPEGVKMVDYTDLMQTLDDKRHDEMVYGNMDVASGIERAMSIIDAHTLTDDEGGRD